MRILVVEDEKRLNKLIAEAMEDEGYSVDCCFDGQEALEFLELAAYDVIIMDIMMPRLDGISAVKRIRDKGDNTPVLFLTAKDSIDDKVTGLESGADYYLTKPFSFDELLAVVHAMTRKLTGNRSNVFAVGDLTVDISSNEVKRGSRVIELSSKEFALLEYMIKNKGVVLTREMIEDNLWNFEYEGGTNVVDVYISYLRKKIDKNEEKKLIHTVWGRGWVLKE